MCRGGSDMSRPSRGRVRELVDACIALCLANHAGTDILRTTTCVALPWADAREARVPWTGPIGAPYRVAVGSPPVHLSPSTDIDCLCSRADSRLLLRGLVIWPFSKRDGGAGERRSSWRNLRRDVEPAERMRTASRPVPR